MRPTIGLVLISLASIMPLGTKSSPVSAQNVSIAIYDQDSSHIWNRLYAALLVRQSVEGKSYGEDSLDPMLWRQSSHLLAEPSHQVAISVLDEFLRTHAEDLIHDPLERAMLQRDLWAVFDWSVEQYSGSKESGQPEYGNEKHELQARLAEVLQRLAPTQEKIRALPNNYSQAVASGVFAAAYDSAHPQQVFLPPDLFDPRGPWVCITPSPDSTGYGGVAKLHVANFAGRSLFLVFVRLPQGRKATFDYFQTLWNFPQPWTTAQEPVSDQSEENPKLPSFPVGTQVALVRQMILFDNLGNLVVSPITESVQIRVYRAITTARRRDFSSGPAEMARKSGQDFFEIRISRLLLFSGKQGGFKATARDETEPPTFQTIGVDLIGNSRTGPRVNNSSPTIMQSCVNCHSGGGISSFNSLDSLLKPTRRQQEPRDIAYGARYWSETNALWWKKNHYDWGLLNGFWNASR